MTRKLILPVLGAILCLAGCSTDSKETVVHVSPPNGEPRPTTTIISGEVFNQDHITNLSAYFYSDGTQKIEWTGRWVGEAYGVSLRLKDRTLELVNTGRLRVELGESSAVRLVRLTSDVTMPEVPVSTGIVDLRLSRFEDGRVQLHTHTEDAEIEMDVEVVAGVSCNVPGDIVRTDGSASGELEPTTQDLQFESSDCQALKSALLELDSL